MQADARRYCTLRKKKTKKKWRLRAFSFAAPASPQFTFIALLADCNLRSSSDPLYRPVVSRCLLISLAFLQPLCPLSSYHASRLRCVHLTLDSAAEATRSSDQSYASIFRRVIAFPAYPHE